MKRMGHRRQYRLLAMAAQRMLNQASPHWFTINQAANYLDYCARGDK